MTEATTVPRLLSGTPRGGFCVCLISICLTACEPAAGPTTEKPPYLAVVAKLEAGARPDPDTRFDFHIVDVSEGGTLDTTISISPADTIILSVRPATYQIDLEDLPDRCVSRYGESDVVRVPEGVNTAISRFYIACQAPLAAIIHTAGGPDSLNLVWQLTGVSTDQRGIIHTKDQTVIFNSLAPGRYTFSLWNIPSNCQVTTPGRNKQAVDVVPEGGTIIEFGIVCSDPEFRPSIANFVWSYHDSALVVLAEVSDPDRDLKAFYLDLTDCEGSSIVPGGEIKRSGLDVGRTRGAPTAAVISAYDLRQLGVSEDGIASGCATLRLEDESGNSSGWVERPALTPIGAAPTATDYNAYFIGTTALRTRLSVADSNGDFFGTFVAAELRDGVLDSADGQLDIGIYNAQGYQGTDVPDLPLGGRISYSDVYAQIVYLVDEKGNFTKRVDRNPFQ